MKYLTIKLPKGKYISQIEPFKTQGLFSNAIYHKTLPGCGITHYAILYFKHCLIIILPNVPVIQSKEYKHNKKYPQNKIRGVYKGVEIEDIKAYLATDVEYKKILTTPEGFTDKVIHAFDNINFMRANYFLLLDECERIITDVDYREAMAAPIDEFFLFENKAMVSATTLEVSDERFKDFKHYVIEPTFDFSKPITVIGTNNVASSLKKHIDKLTSKNLCIFINSTNGILTIVKLLNIGSESKAFCAQDSVGKLFSNGYKNGLSYFEVKDMAKYNFFTSRYFSAIDIVMMDKPDVIMVSDVYFADHSILDPHTEVIQIAGRFRKGAKSLTHITNFKSDIESKTREEALYFLAGSFETYNGFINSFQKTTHPGSRKVLENAIENSFVHPFYFKNKVNTFMVDNFVHKERVKGYYQNFDKLKAAYKQRPKHFKLTFKKESFPAGEKELLQLNGRLNKKERYKIVASIFDRYIPKAGEYSFAPDELINSLIKQYPELWDAHLLIGLKGLEDTGFDQRKFNIVAKQIKEVRQLKILAPHVYNIFKSDTKPLETSVYHDLNVIYKKAGVEKQATKSDIFKFFKGYRSTEKGEHVSVLQEKTFPDV